MTVFKSTLIQNGCVLDATQLYKDIEDKIKEEAEQFPGMQIDRGHPLQHILNSTSGNYVSPTSMKSFDSCPAGYLYGKLVPERTGTATSVGRTVHTILCEFYRGKERNRESIDILTEKAIEEDKQFDKAEDVRLYIKGYMEADDYLGGPMDHKNLVCSTETFIKPGDCKPLGVALGVPIYTLADRIDIRDQGIVIVDYKTGFGDPNPFLLGEGGYLPQMIYYKWAVEAEYGQEILDAYLCLPGSLSKETRYVKMNVHSLVEQSKVIENTLKHIEYARSVRESKQFPESLMRYCNSCQLKVGCTKYRESRGEQASPLFDVIPVVIEYDENLFYNKKEEETK